MASSNPPNAVLDLLKKQLPTDQEVRGYLHQAKSDLGVDFTAIGMSNAYKLIPYGSAVTGLFTQGSDLDFFVYTGKPVSKEKAKELLLKLSRAMAERQKAKQPLYTNISTAFNGRVPTLKAVHAGMNREINLNFTSHAGVNNSYMLKHLLAQDTRIRPMMLLLKIYFKLKLPKNSLTTFNLYSLIIFALQNLQEPLLPALSHLIKSIDDGKVLHENRWPMQFACLEYATVNKATLFDLVLDFCSFYADFPFDQKIVAPYWGKRKPTLTKSNFHEIDEFKCADHQFDMDRPSCVQDFFVLCVNVGGNFDELKRLCKLHHENQKKYEGLSEGELIDAFFQMA